MSVLTVALFTDGPVLTGMTRCAAAVTLPVDQPGRLGMCLQVWNLVQLPPTPFNRYVNFALLSTDEQWVSEAVLGPMLIKDAY